MFLNNHKCYHTLAMKQMWPPSLIRHILDWKVRFYEMIRKFIHLHRSGRFGNSKTQVVQYTYEILKEKQSSFHSPKENNFNLFSFPFPFPVSGSHHFFSTMVALPNCLESSCQKDPLRLISNLHLYSVARGRERMYISHPK